MKAAMQSSGSKGMILVQNIEVQPGDVLIVVSALTSDQNSVHIHFNSESSLEGLLMFADELKSKTFDALSKLNSKKFTGALVYPHGPFYQRDSSNTSNNIVDPSHYPVVAESFVVKQT